MAGGMSPNDSCGRYSLWFTHGADKVPGSFPCARPAGAMRSNTMRKEYDFSQGQRGAVLPSPGKTRITIMLDDDIIDFFRN